MANPVENSLDDFEQRIERAKELVRQGSSQAVAAHRYGIKGTALSYRIRHGNSHRDAASRQQKLTPEQEEAIVNWILHEEVCGRAPSKRYVADFAAEILLAQGDNNTLGQHWVDHFVSRHPQIRTKIGRVVDASRVRASDSNKIRDFYTLLERLRTKYNMDDTGVQEGESGHGTVIGTSNSRRVRVSKSDASSWCSWLEYISHTQRGTPVCVFSGKRVQAQWFPDQNIPEWEYTATSKGWSNKVIANRWLDQVFLPETKPKRYNFTGWNIL